ncbi:MAG: T9SS type A sorting domain-containing protein [Bacteroidota bacterium]
MMRQLLLLTTLISLGIFGARAQSTQILDDAEPGTTLTWSPFGNASTPMVIANPDMSGSNTTANVLQWTNQQGADFFAGASAVVPGGLDLTNLDPSTARITMQIWVPDTAPDTVAVLFKPENPGVDGVDYIDTIFNDRRNQWVELSFNPFDLDRLGAPAAAGRTFSNIVVFVDFSDLPQTPKAKEDVYFVDEIKLEGILPPVQTVSRFLHDLESPATTITWEAFGGAVAPATIANPDMSGLNMSANVEQWENPTGSENFAGAFGDPTGGVDLTNLDPNDGSISYLVWVPDTAPDTVTVQFKLENPGTNAIEYRDTVFSNQRNQWVEIVVDPFEMGANGEPPAAGASWSRVVMFFDFTLNPARLKAKPDIYFLDDLKINGLLPPDSVDVTFSVDMSAVTDPFTTVYVSGTFNAFSGTATPLDDSDNDMIWTGTAKVAEGILEYKFQADDYMVDEIFDGTEECTQRDPSGQFVNRVAQISSDTTLSTVAFGSCYAAGEGAMITFNVGFPDSITLAPEGLFLAGGGDDRFGTAPNDFQLTDPDGDGVYSVTFERRIDSFESFYTFINGPGGGSFVGKENIIDQACAFANNFNDRFIPKFSADTVINTCFAECTDDTNCSITNLRNAPEPLFEVQPTLVARFAEVTFQTAEPKEISIVNTSGQVLRTESTRAASLNLDFEGLPAGLYLIRVQEAQRVDVRKVLKQ